MSRTRENTERRIAQLEEFITKVEKYTSCYVRGECIHWLDAPEELFHEYGFEKSQISDSYYWGDALRLMLDELHSVMRNISQDENDEYYEKKKG